MLGAMFRLFWNSSKRVNPCKASRIIRMLHHSPTRSRLRAMGQAILPKLFRCISKPYASDYHCASDWAALESTFRQVSITRQRISSHRRQPSCNIWGDPYSFEDTGYRIELAHPLLRPLCILRNLQQTCSQKGDCKQRTESRREPG